MFSFQGFPLILGFVVGTASSADVISAFVRYSMASAGSVGGISVVK